MVVLLVIIMFATFIALDYFFGFSKSRVEQQVPVLEPVPAPVIAPTFQAEPSWVSGYQLPEDLHYHRGHTWVRVLDHDTAVVGLDDFARQLIGPATRVKLPMKGAEMRQGATGFGVEVNGKEAEFVSPIQGQVTEVNQELKEHAGLATNDPYGRGWLYRIRTSDLASNLRNLLSGSLARRWMQDSRERLELQLMGLSGTVLQDGGEPVADFACRLSEEDWKRLVGEFLLT